MAAGSAMPLMRTCRAGKGHGVGGTCGMSKNTVECKCAALPPVAVGRFHWPTRESRGESNGLSA